VDSPIMPDQIVFSSESSLIPFALWDGAKVLCRFVNFASVTLETPSVCEIFLITGGHWAYEGTVMSIFMPPTRMLAYTECL